jgi:ABC-2 type transport system permease protein
MKALIRLLSFFGKEFHEIRRQPRLILSLIFGPFLILLLFGIGYAGEQPRLRTALVLPANSSEDFDSAEFEQAISTNFEIVHSGTDEQAAMQLLRTGQVDVVEIIPGDIQERMMRNEQSPLELRYNEIDPLSEQWIQYLGYAQVTEINRAIQRVAIADLQEELAQNGVTSNVTAEVLVSPIQQQYANLRGSSLDVMSFYAPSVLALIVQHIAVTLASLSLVRERLQGSFELFRIAPVSPLQVLLGKYIGYLLYIGLIIAALVGLMIWPIMLGVPFLGDVAEFAGFAALLVLASLGIGFLISMYSKTESQAVQLSMLVLLLSVFFSGFFLPLKNFLSPIDLVGYALPITHGIMGFQAIMLRGISPSTFTWLALAALAGGLFVVVALVAQWNFRRS